VQPLDHRLEFIDQAGGRVAHVGREESDRVVTPVISELLFCASGRSPEEMELVTQLQISPPWALRHAYARANQTVEVEVLASVVTRISDGRGTTHRNDAADPTRQISAHA
jgi:hypothetical protein